jgi:monoamine oxidase
VTLLRELGAITGEDERGRPIPAEEMVVRDPEERVFWNGEWREGLYLREGASSADLAELARFQAEISAFAMRRDDKGRRAFDLPLERSSDDSDLTKLDAMPMSAWLDERGFHSARLRWLVAYACRDDYGLLPETTSAWAGLFYFASRLEGSGEDAAPLFAWTNGNGRIVEHLAGVASQRIRPRHLVVDVATFEDRAEVLALDLTRNEVVRFVAERVIFAAPKMLAARVLRTLRDEKPWWCDRFSYGAWMVANVHLDAHPVGRGAPIAWDNVLYDSPSLGYVVATHQAFVDSGPTVLTYYYAYTDPDPAAGRRLLLQGDHAAFVDLVLTDLAPAHPKLRRHVQRVDVFRWGHAMAQPRVGFLWGGARREAVKPVGRVHMAHSDLSGMGLFEEALHHGIRAAEEIAALVLPSRFGTFPRLAE